MSKLSLNKTIVKTTPLGFSSTVATIIAASEPVEGVALEYLEAAIVLRVKRVESALA